ncbi:uncharacterized protein LOC134260666, partial [Saccostrea cucullata]|uniref:uncharacterized protein LOC134260666 n=1 Tax=Saccostrea cuccullata TaxID=36930 RepID=UPI002ED19563
MKTTQKTPEAGSSPPVKQLLDEPEAVTIINTGYESLYNVVCLSDEEIWAGGLDSTMKLYSINQGLLLKSITTKSRNWSFDLTVTESGDLNEKIEEVIRLQNWEPQGVCSTSSGDLLVIMSEPFSPQGITKDGQRHILIADDKNNSVHIIDQDGQFLRYIDCGLSKPQGLCTDTNDNL